MRTAATSAPPSTDDRRRSRLPAVTTATVVVLALWNNVVHLHPAAGGAAYVPLNVGLAGALLVAARHAGLGRRSIGLPPGGARRGAAAGVVVVGLVALGLAVALAVPALRPLLEDGRFADRSGAGVAWHAAVRVPLGTALLEEVAFRGVLLGLLAARFGTRRAVLASSALFGLWHIRPGWGALAANGASDGALGLAGVAAIVGATTVAGIGFCWLRLRSGHLAAPFVAHAGMNALGTLAAAFALRLAD